MIFGLLTILASSAAPTPAIEIGKFRIQTTVEQVSAFPYPYSHKLTTLAWASSDGLLIYAFQDDGARLQIEFRIRPSMPVCIGTIGPLKFDAALVDFFSSSALLPKPCRDKLTVEEVNNLDEDIHRNEVDFRSAYGYFRVESAKAFGPSNRRCVKFVVAPDGPMCDLYSEEAVR